MYQLKTRPEDEKVTAFLDKIGDENSRADCYAIAAIMEKVTGQPAMMWGTAIIGCDKYHYKYASGHQGEMCLVGFSPRKANITLYLKAGNMNDDDILQKLGKYKMGKGCIYIKRLADINLDILEAIITRSVKMIRQQYPV